jgi:hypothetical protein
MIPLRAACQQVAFMTVSENDRKRLAQIAHDLPYACTMTDLKWLVNFAEKLLKEQDGPSSERRPKSGPGSNKSGN